MQMKIKKSIKSVIGKSCHWTVGVILACYFLISFFVLVSRAFMTVDEIAKIPSALFPSFSLENPFDNFIYAFKMETDVNFLLALWNSTYTMVLRTFGIVVSSFISAFALSRIKFRGRKLLFGCGMVTIMLPGIVTMIPLFTMYSSLGWLNTHLPLWVPSFFGGGMMVIFLEMQFIKSIPKGLDEAAMIDGANYLQIAFLIIMPMIKPVLIFQAVNSAIGSWNDFMGPLTYISTAYPEMYTFPLAFFIQFKNASSVQKSLPNVQSALSLIMMIPTLTLFCFFHNEMINGISLGGGLKG